MKNGELDGHDGNGSRLVQVEVPLFVEMPAVASAAAGSESPMPGPARGSAEAGTMIAVTVTEFKPPVSWSAEST